MMMKMIWMVLKKVQSLDLDLNTVILLNKDQVATNLIAKMLPTSMMVTVMKVKRMKTMTGELVTYLLLQRCSKNLFLPSKMNVRSMKLSSAPMMTCKDVFS